MSTLDKQLYIDAIVVKGIGRTFSVGITQPTDDIKVDSTFDLSNYSVIFRVLGSAEGNGKVLLEKIITQTSDEDTTGIIAEPESGEFTIAITAEDTNTLGLGAFPITILVADAETNEIIFPLTEGGTAQGEFNRIQVVRV